MARSDKEFSPCVLDLLRLDPPVQDSFLDIRSSPCTTACSAAEVVGPGGPHFDKVLTALLGHPSGLIIIPLAKHTLAFASVVARIMVGGQFVMLRLVELNSTLFNIHLEEFVNVDELYIFVGIPFFETKPGRIVGVSSLG
jgi:hypothetical protein